jgi:phosphate transport system substrate-binding protein
MMKKVESAAWVCLMAMLVTIVALPGMAARQRITKNDAEIVGAGATFPAPLYQRWISEFVNKEDGFSIFYDAVGSGEGIRRFMAEEIDFGASDAAMGDEQIMKMKQGVQLIPATAGIIALAYNIPDLNGDLRLSRDVYTDIFLGKIRNWNDERIQALNPGLKLPRLNIVTVTRSDSSGTTWAFTNHLSAISPQWKNAGPGVGKKVDWPGNSMAGRYNEGVAVKISHSWGSIGYVEYGIARRAGLSMASIENKAGAFIKPTDASGTDTLANTSAQMPPNLRMFIPDPEGINSYPIVTYTWLMLYQSYANSTKAEKIKRFVNWGLTDGQKFAEEYGYAPLPQPVAALALTALTKVR